MLAFLVEDLDDDGRDDLILIMEEDLVVLLQKDNGELAAPERYAFSEEDNHSLRLVDIDLDGQKDVIYVAADSRDSLRVRFQRNEGRLGPENPYRIENSRTSLEPIDRGEGMAPGLAYIQSRTAMLAVATLKANGRSSTEVDALKPLVPEGMTRAEMALRFILTNPAISTIIPGMRRLGHVEQNIATSDAGPLPAELQTKLALHRWDRQPTEWSQ